MPIYEYICENCDQVTEVLQKFSDEPLKTCPQCGGSVEKLISMNSFHLKGGGWFDQGYSKTGAQKPAKAPTASVGGVDKPAPAATPAPAASSGKAD